MHDPQNPICNHYDVILLNAKSGQLLFFGEEQTCDRGEYDARHIPASDQRQEALSHKMLT